MSSIDRNGGVLLNDVADLSDTTLVPRVRVDITPFNRPRPRDFWVDVEVDDVEVHAQGQHEVEELWTTQAITFIDEDGLVRLLDAVL